MVRKTGILDQDQVDEMIEKQRPPEKRCERCEKLKREIAAVQKTMNVMLNQTLSELESVKKEKEELRQALAQQIKD